MKYKIKVEVMQNGDRHFYPMVKKHWWTPWECICGITQTSFLEKTYASCVFETTARSLIKEYKGHMLDHTYEIPYKEEE